MNYSKHYFLLMNKAKIRCDVSGYSEKHHIIPKCLNGSNEPSNIVILTAKEHFIAHLLLTKMYPENSKIAFAFRAMSKLISKYHMNGRKFSKLRIEKNLHIGLKRSEETKKRMSEAQKGRIFSEETKRKMSLAHQGQIPWSKGKTFSDEHKIRLSESHKGKRYSKRVEK